MEKNIAFTYSLEPNNKDSNQSSPAWVLTFVRWEIRDTFRTVVTDKNAISVRGPLIVENDCLAVSTSDNKGTLTPSMSATLIQTDVNYMTEVCPGDFVFVNMLQWDEDARRVANQARNGESINNLNDGFKGLYKIQGVRKTIVTEPVSGAKTVLVRITGFAFTEFNNTIHFNPSMITDTEKGDSILFAANYGITWSSINSKKNLTNVQDLIRALIQSFLGFGMASGKNVDKDGNVRSANIHFSIPSTVGTLLGIKGARAAKDIYSYLFGIQSYSSGTKDFIGHRDLKKEDTDLLARALNPTDIRPSGPFNYAGPHCQGNTIMKAEYWNEVQAMSILKQYSNAPINELYTCFRVTPDSKVLPTLVFRQIPFTNDDFEHSGFHVTKFMSLPRWKLHPDLVIGFDLGRDEAARVNFVQVFGKSNLGPKGFEQSVEIAKHNYLYDREDVQRSGLKPIIKSNGFDELVDSKPVFRSPEWARIYGDSLIGGHLKFNGNIMSVGISDPIAVGDNLEFDDVIYHIEQISHACSYSNEGKRSFRTTISVSSGLSIFSGKDGTKYPEMEDTNAYNLRLTDSKSSQILPGVSETQDSVSRTGAMESKTVTSSDNKPYQQPNVKTSIFRSRKGSK